MDKLATAIELTDEILELLDNRDFDKIANIETRREPLIRQAFSDAVEQIFGFGDDSNLQIRIG